MTQRLRVPLGFVIAASVLYLAEPTLPSILVGLPVAVVGALFRAFAAGVIKKDSTLATSGVYALTRNPLYFGSLHMGLGFAVAGGVWYLSNTTSIGGSFSSTTGFLADVVAGYDFVGPRVELEVGADARDLIRVELRREIGDVQLVLRVPQ